MSEARPDAEPAKAPRQAVPYAPTAKTAPDPNGRSRTVVWVAGICVMAALVLSGLYFTTAPTPVAHRSAAAGAK